MKLWQGHTPLNQTSWALGGQGPAVPQPGQLFTQGGTLGLPPPPPAAQPLLCVRFRVWLASWPPVAHSPQEGPCCLRLRDLASFPFPSSPADYFLEPAGPGPTREAELFP